MAEIIANDGTVVTEQMIASWSEALDNDEWPEGWINVGDPIEGAPQVDKRSETITSKVSKAMKDAVTSLAAKEGISTSDAVRNALSEWLIARSAR